MAPARKALLQIHLCVVIWGFTAVLGKLITLPAFALVWWRMFLVVVVIAVLPAFWRGVRPMSPRTLAIFAGIGIVIALHWIAFFAAIKLANASVAATCMGVAPLIMSMIEPWITRRPFEPRELLIGIVAIPGVMLVVGGTPDAMLPGLAVGILSAFLVAVFGSLNKRYIAAGEPLAVTGLELASGTAFMTLLALAFGGAITDVPLPDWRDLRRCCSCCPSSARCSRSWCRWPHCVTSVPTRHSSRSASSPCTRCSLPSVARRAARTRPAVLCRTRAHPGRACCANVGG